MPSKKYNEERIVALAKQEVIHAGNFTELAVAVGIPRCTLRGVLQRQGFGHGAAEIMGALLVTSGEEALADFGLLQRQADYLKKVVKRLEARLTDRAWLKEEVAGQMAVMEPITVRPPAYSGPDHQAQVAVLELSDVHYGLDIPSGQLGPLFGAYNTDIAKARVDYTFRTFARLAHQQSFPVNKAVVYVLGDLIEHSNMRPAQAKYTSAHVVKQTIDMARLLTAGTRMLCGEFKEVEVHCIPGNHGRATQKAGDNLPDETFEHLLYHISQIALSAQPNLAFTSYPAWYFIHDILGFKFLGLHGEDAFSWAGIPWYGVKRLVQDYYTLAGQASKDKLRSLSLSQQMTVGEFLDMLSMPDAVVIGHNHTPIAWALMGIQVLANGAACGASFYSAKRLHRHTPPTQKMFFTHPNHGIGLRLDIDLAHIGEQ